MFTIGVTEEFFSMEDGPLRIARVWLPDVGEEMATGHPHAEIDTDSEMYEVFSPLCGKVVEVNEPLKELTELLQTDMLDGGWMWKMDLEYPSELDELVDAAAFDAAICAREADESRT